MSGPAKQLATSARVDGFTDAVLAIILTLMAVELAPPSAAAVERHGLTRAVLELWPAFLAFALSFMLVGQVWMSHHSMWRWIARVDRPLLALQLIHLLFVSLVPFVSRLLAEHLQAESADSETGAAFYAAIVLMNGLFFNAVWLYARAKGLLARDLDPRLLRAMTIRYATGVPLYAAALMLSFVNVWLSLAVYLALIVYFMVPTPGEQHATDSESAAVPSDERL